MIIWHRVKEVLCMAKAMFWEIFKYTVDKLQQYNNRFEQNDSCSQLDETQDDDDGCLPNPSSMDINGKPPLTEKDMNGILNCIANQIAHDWKRLGRCLGIKEAKLHQIDMDHDIAYEKAMQTLISWTQTLPSIREANFWNTLKSALIELQRNDIVGNIERSFPSIVDVKPKHPAYQTQASTAEDRTACTIQNSDIADQNNTFCMEIYGRKILDIIANDIAEEWKRLGRYLGIEDARLNQINMDNNSAYEKASQTLNIWKQSTISYSWDKLKSVLIEIKRNDIIGNIESKINVQHTGSLKPLAVVHTDQQPAYYAQTSTDDSSACTVLNSKVPDKLCMAKYRNIIFDSIACDIAEDWKRLGRFLRIEDAKLKQISMDNNRVYEKAIQTLMIWKQSTTSFSWDVLRSALAEIKRNDIVGTIENRFLGLPEGNVELGVETTAPPELQRNDMVESIERGLSVVTENNELPTGPPEQVNNKHTDERPAFFQASSVEVTTLINSDVTKQLDTLCITEDGNTIALNGLTDANDTSNKSDVEASSSISEEGEGSSTCGVQESNTAYEVTDWDRF